MLRTDLNIIMDAARPTLGVSVAHLRGKAYLDSADLVLYKADGQLVGTAFSIPVYRKASLANGIYQYYDEAGNLLATNAE